MIWLFKYFRLVDLVGLAVPAVAFLGLTFTQPFVRPVLLGEWQAYAQPHQQETVSYTQLVLMVNGAPLAVGLGAAAVRCATGRTSLRKAFGDLRCFFVAFLFSTMWTACFTELLKVTYGGLRPDFLNRCFPDRYPAVLQELAALEPVPACTNPDASKVAGGRRSFPSGHSSSTAASFVFCALYLGRQLRSARMGLSAYSVPVLLFMVPLWTGMTRTSDFRHHPVDVLAGLALGTVIAVGSYVVFYGQRRPLATEAEEQLRQALGWEPSGTRKGSLSTEADERRRSDDTTATLDVLSTARDWRSKRVTPSAALQPAAAGRLSEDDRNSQSW